jgi:stage II sporulation protein D
MLLCIVASSCGKGSGPSSVEPGTRATSPSPSPAGPSDPEIDAALLKAATESLGDREGSILIMDPSNGRIRAVLNPRLAYEQAFPPGSTIKAFTSLAAMRTGLIDSHSAIRCGGQYSGKEFQVVCSHPKSEAPFDLPQALAYSCNYYFAKTAERLSNGVFQSTLAGFGFGTRTGISGSESPGRIPGADWNIKTALGEGDQLLVTPIQLLRGYVALICGGHLFRPRQAEAQGFKADETGGQSISGPERAALVRGMRGAVSFGTAAESGLKSLPVYVFGKTGTSTSSSGFRTQGWFVGFASRSEATDQQPLIAVLAFLKRSHGSECAAMTTPIFAEYARLIGRSAAETTSVRPERPAQPPTDLFKSPEATEPVVAPAVRNPSRSPVSSPDIESAPPAAVVVADRAICSFVGDPPGRAAGLISSPASELIKVHLVRENVTRAVPLEQYVLGVLRAEASIEDRVEALKAQAIISRTFALKNSGRHRSSGYDFCSLTHCERYSETPMKGDRDALARRAVAETEGQVLSDEHGALVDPYFHASCGGMTADIGTLWGVTAPSYLRGVRDEYCRTMPNNNWTQRISVEKLARALESDPKTNIGSRLTDIRIVKRDHTGRAELLQIEGRRRAIVRGWDFKMIVGRSLGWNMIKSSRFEVSRDGGDFIFRGSGFGHGLGLCQEGAHEMARLGFSYSQIIGHYFPGTTVSAYTAATASGRSISRTALWIGGLSPRAAGFQPASLRPASLRPAVSATTGSCAMSFGSVLAVPARQTESSENFIARFNSPVSANDVQSVLASAEAARHDLLGRLNRASLSLGGESKVQLIFNATTQEFVAATGQPWWAAAATRGTEIELQPLATLKKRGILGTTIRHEYAHYVIDRLSGGKAPRWLAEGLAAYFAGEGSMLARYQSEARLSTDELDQRLNHASSQEEMRSLYAASLRAVVGLIKADGEPATWRRAALARGL